MSRPYKTIVLTGGPCAGKTSARVALKEWLNEIGYVLIWLSEVPTEVMREGLTPRLVGDKSFQEQVVKTMLEKEARRHEWARICAKRGHKVVAIFDRGVMDAKTYMSKKDFKELCKQLGGEELHWRDTRYDAAIHMRTAAFGAEDHYTSENNSMRRETPEEARIVDEDTLRAWTGHPHVHIIENQPNSSFDHKINRVRQAVAHELGEPVPMEIERKYLVRGFYIPVPYESIEIEQTYLTGTNEKKEERVRKRSQNGSVMYVHTTKEHVVAGERIEREHIIGKQEYRNLMRRRKSVATQSKRSDAVLCGRISTLNLTSFSSQIDSAA